MQCTPPGRDLIDMESLEVDGTMMCKTWKKKGVHRKNQVPWENIDPKLDAFINADTLPEGDP